ncbi:MAG: hypothetical protein J7639_03310 [Paenibacillaceae bacterium]|nr:hypothetical protein [Paenibacillaceae bacterium]
MKKSIVLAAVLAVSLLAGCRNGDGTAKQDVLSALGRQAEMNNYRFSGDAELKLGNLPQQNGLNAVTTSLMTMFLGGKLEWSGVTGDSPLRLEATVKSTPAGSSTALELPILFQDNKLYVNIPLLNKKDEYYVLGADQLGSAGASALQSLPRIAADASRLLADAIDAKSFKEAKEQVTLKDGTQAKRVTLDITAKNKDAVSTAVSAKWPAFVDSLKSGGLLTNAQADQLKAEANVQLAAGDQLAATIDADGFIRELLVKVAFSTAQEGGTPQSREINLHAYYDQINRNPAFEKEVPKTTKPFDDVLKALKPQAK